MILNLESLLRKEKKAIGIMFEESIPDIDYYGSKIRLSGVTKATGSIQVFDEHLYLKMEIETVVIENCSRCLTDLTIPMKLDVEGYLVNFDHEDDEDQDGIFVYNGETLNLSELIEASIVLNIPQKLVCTEECKGLCMDCGGNLNKGECTCNEDEIDENKLDPRLLKLKDFFKK